MINKSSNAYNIKMEVKIKKVVTLASTLGRRILLWLIKVKIIVFMKNECR